MDQRSKSAIKHSPQLPAAIGAVYEFPVVVFCEVPVISVPFNEAGDNNEPQNHQIDPSEDFVHESRLTHAKGQKSWGQEVDGDKREASTTHPATWVDIFILHFQQTISQRHQFILTLLLAGHTSCDVSVKTVVCCAMIWMQWLQSATLARCATTKLTA